MDKDNNYLPDIPTGEELAQGRETFLADDEWQDIDIEGDWLNVEDEYERPEWTLAYNGIPFAPLKGIHSLTGQPGHGKTMTFTQIMCAILKGKYGNLTYELTETHPNPTVLYIDTEMEKGNTQLVNLRVYSIMGWSYGVPHEEFRVLMLRETDKAEDRWRKTLKALYTMKPTVCFIDGLLDIVSDFNDNVECQSIIYKCMKVASHYGISLWCLVHENPGSTKMVGHLGSMLERKVTDSFGTVKDKDPLTGKVKFTVKQKKARGKDIPDWEFVVVDDSHKYGIPQQVELVQEQEDLRRRQVYMIFSQIPFVSEGTTWKTIDSCLQSKFAMTSRRQREKILDEALEYGIVERNAKKKYFFKGEGTKDDAEQGAIPFDNNNEEAPF